MLDYAPGPGFSVQRHTPVVMDRSHTHAHLEVNFLTGARMLYQTPQGEVWVEPNQITLFWAQFDHQAVIVEGQGEIININLPLDSLSQLQLPIEFLARLFRGDILFAKDQASFDRPLFRHWHADWTSAVQWRQQQTVQEVGLRIRRMAMAHIQSQGLQTASPPDLVRIQKMLNFVFTRYLDAITVDQVAASAGLSVSQARRIFQRLLDCGVHSFIRRLRLSHAHRMIVRNEKPVTAIALEVGFNSLSGFYSAFTDEYGLPPGQAGARTRTLS
ncbi:helix-turn-helix domain-containing protein [Litorivicinus lipolyticus]|uniref:Helix-turn-helix domain-containing protein n=1 Tax=Litorivicinus lipolyticus TaxID=418701 RepID=A0A5Q2QCU7_9GAMM|nr:helix-turn-helix domain-containing protein [Litorivicinus lipolyticus]QGG81133.1 helix-turn-helix domain-containing protein [Litorivicinus lipolyticus]